MKLPRSFRSGFSLIEVTIALGIATFCLVALFALLPMGLNQNRDTIEQTIATSIAANIASDIRASLQAQVEAKKTGGTPPTQSLNYKIDLPFDGNGAVSVTDGQKWEGGFDEGQQYLTSPEDRQARYRAVVEYHPDTTNNQSISARIVVSWPAAVDWTSGKNPSGSVDTVTAFVAP
jgi:uncharacterized protein (TIGR02598 family)